MMSEILMLSPIFYTWCLRDICVYWCFLLKLKFRTEVSVPQCLILEKPFR